MKGWIEKKRSWERFAIDVGIALIGVLIYVIVWGSK